MGGKSELPRALAPMDDEDLLTRDESSHAFWLLPPSDCDPVASDRTDGTVDR